MKLISSKALLAALALTVLAAPSFAGELRRIDHPNGPATFVHAPSSKTTTVAVSVNGQGVASEGVRYERPENRKLVIHQGRGQTLTVPQGVR